MGDFEDGNVDSAKIKEFQKSVFSQVQHMTSTLNEFRSFFRPNKDVEEFDVKEMISKVLLLVKDEFIKHNISINVNDGTFSILGVENEFKHLILNIINNAKDAFIDNNIEDRNIKINILEGESYKSIEIIDNAGGIPANVIEDIFKANVTTKEEGKGTGIGLYMSSQIATKHHGVLSVQNVDDGAMFEFRQEIM